MIGKKYSNKRCLGNGSVIFHDFKYILGKNAWIFFITIVFFLITIPFFTAGLPGDSIFNVEVTHDQLKFRLIHENVYAVVLAGCVGLGMVSGICSFLFLHEKKETTIFLSLGLTRGQLFLNRCVSGLLMLAVGIIIPMLISMGLNINAVGMYEGLVRNAVYLTAGLCATSFISFFVTAAVGMVAGTLAETIVYWCGIMASPYLICCGLNRLMKTLFWGNAWGVMMYSKTSMVRPELSDQYSFLNPCTYFFDELKKHAQFMRPLETSHPADIEPSLLAGWCVVIIALLILSMVLMKQRKAEIAGISGTNRWLSEWLIAITAFTVFQMVFAFLFSFSPKLSWFFSVAGVVVVQLFWRKVLFSYETKSRRNIMSVVIQVCAFLVVCLGFQMGGTLRIESFLEHGEITEASVTYVGAPSHLFEHAEGSSTGRSYYLTSNLTFDETDEIAEVTELQKYFIADGKQELAEDEETFSGTVVPYDIVFRYKDNKGKEYVWYYDRASLSQLESMLYIEELQSVKEGQDQLFSGNLETEKTVWAQEAYKQGNVYLTDVYCSQTYELNLTEEQRWELLEAIRCDIKSSNLTDRYFPEQQTRAVLMFSRNGEYDCQHYAYNLDNSFIYLTNEYVSTISWLEDHQLFDLLDENVQVESVTLQRFNPYIGINGMNYPMGMYFMSYRGDTLDEFVIQKDFGLKYTITDQDMIAQILPGLRNGYFMSDGGYLAAVKVSGVDGYIYLFLPSKYVPEFVKG